MMYKVFGGDGKGNGGMVRHETVKEIIQQNAIQLKRLQDENKDLMNEVRRLEQYETFYNLYKELKE